MIMRIFLAVVSYTTSIYGMNNHFFKNTKDLATIFFKNPYNNQAFNKKVLDMQLQSVYRNFDTMVLRVVFQTDVYEAEPNYENITVSRYIRKEEYGGCFLPQYIFCESVQFKNDGADPVLPKANDIQFPIKIEMLDGKFITRKRVN